MAGLSVSNRHPEAVTIFKAEDEPVTEAVNWPRGSLTTAGPVVCSFAGSMLTKLKSKQTVGD